VHDTVGWGEYMSSTTATSPPRGFTPEELALLAREQRYQLCYGLLTELGLQVRHVEPRAESDDLTVEITPVLSPRSVRIRILYRPASQQDLDDLATLARADGLADYLLVSTHPDPADRPATGSHHLCAAALIELLEASALVQWTDGIPQVARTEFVSLRTYQETLPLIDTLGLRWLSVLALNKLPWQLRRYGGSADDWFERIFFRVASNGLRLMGQRLGSAGRGQRLPDGLLLSAKYSSGGLLYDCKAARDGYVMTADHERRLIEYGKGRYDLDGVAVSASSIVIVSSYFPGGTGQRHPFYLRQESIRRECGLDLAYVRAADITALLMELGEQSSTTLLEAIDWPSCLTGLVELDTLRRAAGVI
jgi:hypothetical protein